VITAETQSATTSVEAADSEPREQPYPQPEQSNSEKIEQWANDNITEVRWGLTVNLGNYESARIDATAVVSPGENPEGTQAKLKEWVLLHSPATRDQWDEMYQQQRRFQSELATLEAQVVAAKQAWESVRAFMDSNGLRIPEKVVEDLPF